MKLFASLIVLLFGSLSFAIVDMKNANYSNSWIDLGLQGTGYDLKVSRTYNSRTLFSGMFGFGWCSEFETSINPTPEGNILLRECGAGQEVVFSPASFSRKDKEQIVSSIINKVRAARPMNESYYKELTNQLLDSDSMRIKYAQEFGVKVPIKEGVVFKANGREIENFTLGKDYYQRNLSDGSSMRFSRQGSLTTLFDKNGNFIKIDYDRDLIKEISDNNGRRLRFSFYPSKKVKSISGPNNLNVEYKFTNLDDLSYVKNSWNNEYNYTYDEAHNLTKATYPDGTFIGLQYDIKNDWVTSFTDRQKCIESYTYDSDKDDKGHFWSQVKKVCDKETVADNKYEFWHKKRADGENYLQRVTFVVGGVTSDITYHEIFGKPTSISKNGEKVTFEYFPDGLIKTKASALSIVTYTYDATVKKISSVKTKFFNEKAKVAVIKVNTFKYDAKGNLVYAENSDGQKITMSYDHKGRISTIRDQAKKLVKIEYEERFGKPSIVTRPGLGTIQVTYKANGEISKVDSKEGPVVAMQVASTFNNLLDIIAPASADVLN
jgi:YD repeat-containing protein